MEVFYTQLFKVNEQYILRTLEQPREAMWLLKSFSNNSEWTQSYPKCPAMRQSVNMLLTHRASKVGFYSYEGSWKQSNMFGERKDGNMKISDTGARSCPEGKS